MLELDALMHDLVVRRHGGDNLENDYHWMTVVEGKICCLYCNGAIYDLVENADEHAMQHLKEHNLLPFI
jgi:hypothetical protein